MSGRTTIPLLQYFNLAFHNFSRKNSYLFRQRVLRNLRRCFGDQSIKLALLSRWLVDWIGVSMAVVTCRYIAHTFALL